MPIGAENIGTAYVRVIADGKDFDLADMLRGHEGDGEMAGRRLSQKYISGFTEEWEKKPNQTKLRDSIYKAMISGDAAKMFTATRNFQNFRAGLINEFGDIGKRAGQNLQSELEGGRLDLSGFAARMQNINRDLVRAEDQLNREMLASRKAYYDEAYAMNSAFDKKQAALQRAGVMQEVAILEDRNRMLREAYALDAQFNRQRIRQMRDTISGNNELVRTYRQLRADIDLMTRGEIEHGLSVTETAQRLKDLTTQLRGSSIWNRQVEADVKRHHDALLRMHPTLNRYRNSLNTIADATGAAFGRGSRNDFLNFTGSVARNVIRLGGSLLSLAGYFGGLRNRMLDAGSMVGALGVALGDIRKFALLGIGGLTGLFGIIGPLTSVLSGLGGMILAVASTMGGALLGAASSLGSVLAFGLGGGAAIASTAFVPLLAGIGVLTLAIKNADKETKAAFKSIGEGFSGLGETAADSTFANIDEQARRFKEIIGDLSPLVRGVGRAISNVGDNWLDMMEGPGFAQFRRALEDYLPGAVEALGTAVGNLAGGLAGLFRAAIPESQSFLGWLQRITGDFNKFANSAAGQTELKAFFARAADSAADLGGFVLALTGLLAELFDQANQPGDRLFASMTNGLKGWTDALNENPDIMQGWIESMENFGDFVGSARDLLLELLAAGQEVGDSLFASMSDAIDGWVATLRANPDILSGWYDSAASFARVLGDVTVGFAKIFDALDNDFSRGVLIGVFEALAGAIDLFAGSLEVVASLFGDASSAVQGFAGQAAGAAVAFGILNKAMGAGIITTLGAFITNLRNAETRMGALGGVARGAAGAGGLLAFAQGASTSNEAAGILLQTLGGAGTGFALGGPWGALIGGAAGLALGVFGDSAKDAGKDAATATPQVADFASTLDKVTGAATAATRELVLLELQEAGVVTTANQLGIATRDLVSAALGHKGASKSVSDALERQQQKEFELAMSGKDLTDKQKDLNAATTDLRAKLFGTTKEFADQRREVQLNAGATAGLSEILKGFRDSVRGGIKAEIKTNAPVVYGDFSALIRQFGLVPKEVRTLVRNFGSELSKKQINELIRLADDLGGKKPTPRINIDKSAADARLAILNRDLTAVGNKIATPKVTVDASSALQSFREVDQYMSALNGRVATTYVNTVRTVTGPQGGAITGQTAAGGIFDGLQRRIIAESGPEAVVPLARNLSQVDPSVRALSAIAQGKMSITTATAPAGKTISADGWTIISNSANPEVVARETFDRLAAAGY